MAGETDDFQVVEEWEPVTEADVQTPSEVYAKLAGMLPPASNQHHSASKQTVESGSLARLHHLAHTVVLQFDCDWTEAVVRY